MNDSRLPVANQDREQALTARASWGSIRVVPFDSLINVVGLRGMECAYDSGELVRCVSVRAALLRPLRRVDDLLLA